MEEQEQEDWEVAYKDADKDARDAKRLAKRLRVRLTKAEKEAVSRANDMDKLRKELTKSEAHTLQLEQRLSSSDMALKVERQKALALKEEERMLKDTGNMSQANDTGGSIFKELNETPNETALRAELRLKTDEVGRRAVEIGKLENAVALSGKKSKMADARAVVAEGRLVQQQAMIDFMGKDAVENEVRGAARGPSPITSHLVAGGAQLGLCRQPGALAVREGSAVSCSV